MVMSNIISRLAEWHCCHSVPIEQVNKFDIPIHWRGAWGLEERELDYTFSSASVDRPLVSTRL